MISSFYTASTGAIQAQRGMDVVANNVANVSTDGYKPENATFSDLIYTKGQADNVKEGHGARLANTNTTFVLGAVDNTDRILDFALSDNNTFFAVQTPNGTQYTRVGNFHLSERNGKYYLTSQQNYYVLGPDSKPIEVDPNSLQNGFDPNKVGVFSFENVDGLLRQGDNLFLATGASGNANVMSDAKIRQGCIENSAVNLSDEITNMIQSQKAFQFNCRMVQMSDEIMQTVNNLR